MICYFFTFSVEPNMQPLRILNGALIAASGMTWGILADKFSRVPAATFAGGTVGVVVASHLCRIITVHPVASAIGVFVVPVVIATND